MLTIGALLPIMNPFSTAPLFVAMTRGFDRKRQVQQALMGCIYAFGILLVFFLLGTALIDFFGISVPGIRVAGGLVISAIGFRMMFPNMLARLRTVARAQQHDPDIAFTPLAMPSLAGPGSISVVVSAAAQIRSVRPDDWGYIYAAVIVGMALTLAISFLV